MKKRTMVLLLSLALVALLVISGVVFAAPKFASGNFFAVGNPGDPTMTGLNNTGVGVGALRSNTTGSANTATGRSALFSNTTGQTNTATGTDALLSSATGRSNTATGVSALQSNTKGSFNTAIGAFALFSNATGANNTTIGYRALQSNTKGYNNTGIGVAALASTTGNNNTASGRNALRANTTGFNNTGIGHTADVSAGDLTNATAIGAFAMVDASNKIRLGDGAVTVVETAGDVFVQTQGLGIILRDTDGAGCHRITVDSSGTMSATTVTCP